MAILASRQPNAAAKPAASRNLARAALLFSLVFLLLLAALHFLKPAYDPSWRMISEYEIGPFGWVMRLAFLCWSGAVATLTASLWQDLSRGKGRIARAGLAVIAVALVGAALFAPDPIYAQTRNPTNILHSIAGSIVILGFPFVATRTRSALKRDPAWQASMPTITWATALVWLSIALFFGVEVFLSATRPSMEAGPDFPIGWPNRLFAVCYHVWLMVVAWQVARRR